MAVRLTARDELVRGDRADRAAWAPARVHRNRGHGRARSGVGRPTARYPRTRPTPVK